MTNKFIGLISLTRREVSRFMRVWSQTLVPPIITSVLFILIFGYSLEERIGSIAGVSYLEFILPGLLMMGVLMSAYTNTSSSLYISKFQKNIQEVLVAPLAYWEIIAGLTVAAVLRGFLVGTGILLVGILFTSLKIVHFWVIVYFLFFVALIFAFAGIITALWATSFDKMNVFAVFLITPLTYLGGVFYSIEMLPGIWQKVALFNPILYMVDGFRYGFLGVGDVSLGFSAFLVLALATVFFVICMWLFKIGYGLRS